MNGHSNGNTPAGTPSQTPSQSSEESASDSEKETVRIWDLFLCFLQGDKPKLFCFCLTDNLCL